VLFRSRRGSPAVKSASVGHAARVALRVRVLRDCMGRCAVSIAVCCVLVSAVCVVLH
jgi:hypothetical protein